MSISSTQEPPEFSINCSEDTSVYRLPLPQSGFFLHSLNGGYTAMLIIATIATVVIYILAALHIYFVHRFVSLRSRRIPLYWLLGLFPFASACLLMGMWMPRTAYFLIALAWLYLMVCFILLVETVKRLFGGRTAMSQLLIENEQRINFRVPPCCLCCLCLPSAYPSEKNLRRVEWMVLQTVVVRILVMVSAIILAAELNGPDSLQIGITVISTIQGISLLFALFGCHVLVTLAKERLSSFRLLALFRVLDGTGALFGLLDFICTLLVEFKAMPCGPVLSKKGNSNYWYSFILICGLMLMSCLATFLFHPKKSELFDRHPSRQSAHQLKNQISTVTDNTSAIEM